MQNFSSFHIDKAVVGQNAISKNANNVVISSPSVFMFSHNIELFHSFHFIWSSDHAHFRFGRQGAPKFFFEFDFLGNRLCDSRNFFGVVCPATGPTYVTGDMGLGVKFGGEAPKVNFFFVFLL